MIGTAQKQKHGHIETDGQGGARACGRGMRHATSLAMESTLACLLAVPFTSCGLANIARGSATNQCLSLPSPKLYQMPWLCHEPLHIEPTSMTKQQHHIAGTVAPDQHKTGCEAAHSSSAPRAYGAMQRHQRPRKPALGKVSYLCDIHPSSSTPTPKHASKRPWLQ
jgi:hypothetical protein